MARDYMYIGEVPPEESCIQVSSAGGYLEHMRCEALLYVQALIYTLGAPPENTSVAIRREEHDFGTYYNVVCWYDDTNEVSVEYAFRAESEGPSNWPTPAFKCAAEMIHLHHSHGASIQLKTLEGINAEADEQVRMNDSQLDAIKNVLSRLIPVAV